MSEQNKSNVQALGAGLIGFVAVMAVGGGALMFYSSQQSRSAATPTPAAAPIDLGSSMPRPSAPPAGFQQGRPQQSPAPLIGDDDASAAAEAPAVPAPSAAPAAAPAAPAAADLSPESAPAAKASALGVARHLDVEGRGSTAEARVANTAGEDKSEAKPAAKLSRTPPKTKLVVPAGDGAVASTVHYGVTSRSELMGRAAGPVYNIKGGAQAGGDTVANRKLATDAQGKIADLRKQLEASGLPADQREKLLKDLDATMKTYSETPKTAQ
jgi:hypothetical protein